MFKYNIKQLSMCLHSFNFILALFINSHRSLTSNAFSISNCILPPILNLRSKVLNDTPCISALNNPMSMPKKEKAL